MVFFFCCQEAHAIAIEKGIHLQQITSKEAQSIMLRYDMPSPERLILFVGRRHVITTSLQWGRVLIL